MWHVEASLIPIITDHGLPFPQAQCAVQNMSEQIWNFALAGVFAVHEGVCECSSTNDTCTSEYAA